MTALRIVQVSDTHLSRTHAYFYDNWRVFVVSSTSHACWMRSSRLTLFSISSSGDGSSTRLTDFRPRPLP